MNEANSEEHRHEQNHSNVPFDCRIVDYKPDGLPIGISKTTVATPIKGWPAGDYAGVTCAAHTGAKLTKSRWFADNSSFTFPYPDRR
jgi:hypothetical protein